MSGDYELTPSYRCPTCNSPSPHMHPSVQIEGEVELCINDYHLIRTNQNRQEYIDNVLAKRERKALTS